MKRPLLITTPRGVEIRLFRAQECFSMRRRPPHLPLWEQLHETRSRNGDTNADAYPTAYAMYRRGWHRHEEIG